MFLQKTALNPKLTLMDSAQAFHWAESPDGWAALCGGRAICVREKADGWEILCDAGDEYAKTYFALDDESERLADSLAKGLPGREIALTAISLLPGLRVLCQSPWDALLAFLCSANNNVARIRQLSLALCEYGETREIGGLTARGYPSPETLARVSEAELRERRFGYRAAYIAKSARMVADGFPLGEASRLPYNEARELLTRLPGVGGKVADCVLLFGCGHEEAFPVDVWVERLLRDWFDISAPNRDACARAARERFGPKAGLIQQYLFHCARTGLIPVSGANIDLRNEDA